MLVNRGLYFVSRVSTYSSTISLERVGLPLPVMLRLAAIIADDIEARRAAAPAQADEEDSC